MSRGAVGTLATMWQRIPGNIAADIADRAPLSYSLLVLPHEQSLKSMGVSDEKALWGRTRDHPYASWTTKSFVKGTTLKQALVIAEKENASAPRLAKIRITFFDGVQLTLERSKINDPSSLACVGLYDPSGLFRETTSMLATQSRLSLTKQLQPLSDDQGRISNPNVVPPKTFSSEVLYRNCPPPQLQQPGYAFSPMSHISYLTRPNQKLVGIRPGVCDTAPAAVNFRPRAFLRSTTRGDVTHNFTENPEVFQLGSRTLDLALQAEVIDQRNTVQSEKQQLSPLGTLRSHSSLRPLVSQ